MKTATEAGAGQGIAVPSSDPEVAAAKGVKVKPEEGGARGGRSDMRGASDDEILGIGRESGGKTQADRGASGSEADTGRNAGDARHASPESAKTQTKDEASGLEAVLAANPELRQAWDDAKAYRQSFRTPEDARAATAALADLARMDTLFFSGRPQDHAELARVVASLDPAAFRSLAKAMTEVAGQGQRSSGDQAGAESGAAGGQRTTQAAQADANRVTEAAPQRGVTPAQEEFFHATNAAAVQAVIDSIESQVERLLPAEISKGARNRLVGEIYRELDASLRADRQFASQAREAFRSGALDEEHRQAVVAMFNNRARQALPAVARRVLNEWTSAIVAANQDRRARQRAAERRVDIAGSGRTGSDGRRPATPKEINYSRMSDADILNL